jgi:hypothetical protein
MERETKTERPRHGSRKTTPRRRIPPHKHEIYSQAKNIYDTTDWIDGFTRGEDILEVEKKKKENKRRGASKKGMFRRQFEEVQREISRRITAKCARSSKSLRAAHTGSNKPSEENDENPMTALNDRGTSRFLSRASETTEEGHSLETELKSLHEYLEKDVHSWVTSHPPTASSNPSSSYNKKQDGDAPRNAGKRRDWTKRSNLEMQTRQPGFKKAMVKTLTAIEKIWLKMVYRP